jgi:hypothetical protein
VPEKQRQNRYIIYSHDAWGTTTVGNFETEDTARKVLQDLSKDHWFVMDGGIKKLSLVERGEAFARTLEEWNFAGDESNEQ